MGGEGQHICAATTFSLCWSRKRAVPCTFPLPVDEKDFLNPGWSKHLLFLLPVEEKGSILAMSLHPGRLAPSAIGGKGKSRGCWDPKMMFSSSGRRKRAADAELEG